MKYSIIKGNLIQQENLEGDFIMQKIRDYIDRFFKCKKKNTAYALTTTDMVSFMDEFQSSDINGIFRTIITLFEYGYIKGYRAAKAEMKKAGVA